MRDELKSLRADFKIAKKEAVLEYKNINEKREQKYQSKLDDLAFISKQLERDEAKIEEKFGIEKKYNLKMASDNQGNIWLSFAEPFPHIAKFSIQFKDKKI